MDQFDPGSFTLVEPRTVEDLKVGKIFRAPNQRLVDLPGRGSRRRQLEITDLARHGDAGQVTTRATIHNQHGQLVLDGEHTYLLRTVQHGTSDGTS